MPSFQCQVCQARFEIPQATLDRYPGWQPKYCRDHSPNKTAASPKKAAANRPGRGGANRARPLREENLTPAEARAKYSDGPASGVFTDGSASPNPGPGGWGVVWVENGEIVTERHGHDPDTTNNRMELRALIEAFALLPEDASAIEETLALIDLDAAALLADLEAVARLVNGRIGDIVRAAPKLEKEEVAILAALNVGDELLRQRAANDAESDEVERAVEAARGRLADLVKRMEQAAPRKD